MMGVNYGRRKNDDEMIIDMIPKWLRITMIVVKGTLVIVPFGIASIAMFWESDMGLMDKGIWNCIWMFSLLHMISYVDDK